MIKLPLLFCWAPPPEPLPDWLLAPNSGKQIRHKISEAAHDALYDAENAWEDGSERLKDLADTVLHRSDNYPKKGSKGLKD